MLVSAIAEARKQRAPVVRPDEVGISWGARYFYAIARTLGWETAQAELGTPNWEER